MAYMCRRYGGECDHCGECTEAREIGTCEKCGNAVHEGEKHYEIKGDLVHPECLVEYLRDADLLEECAAEYCSDCLVHGVQGDVA